MSYTNYSQNNPAWSGLHLGNSSWTMGQAGCFVTSMAVVATNLGHEVTPNTMLALLEQHNLINGNGDITSPSALCVVFPDIQLISSNTWPTQKADLSVLHENTIIEIDDSPSSGMQTHFMPVIQVIGSDVQVMDVWDGVVRNVSAYGARWNPAVSAAAIIYGAWTYAKSAPPKPVTPMITLDQLTQVFQDLLHRAPDSDAIAHYVGHYTYDFTVQDVSNSAERKQLLANEAAAAAQAAQAAQEKPSEPTTPPKTTPVEPSQPPTPPVTPPEVSKPETPAPDNPPAKTPTTSPAQPTQKIAPRPTSQSPAPEKKKVVVVDPTYYRIWELILAILKKIFNKK